MQGKRVTRIRLGVLVAMAAFAVVSRAADTEGGKDAMRALPSKALVAGVPFVSFSEAAQWRYEQKDIVNPSIVAANRMIRRYWGQDRTELFNFGPEEYRPEHWKNVEREQGKGLDDLKVWLVRGVPVYVNLPRTPHAHPDATGGIGLILFSKEAAATAQTIPSSGVLSRWATLPVLLQMGEKSRPERKHLHFWQSSTAAARVVIGYDDERKVMIVHDPSFGPAWEMGYEDFLYMWQFNEFVFMARPPEGYVEFVAKRPPAHPYPRRTPDMRAAFHYVSAYGLAQSGKTAEAAQELEQGLTIADMGRGYRFLLSLELGILRKAAGRPEEAIASLRSAIEAMPEAPAPWDLLAKIYRENPSLPDAQQQGMAAGQKVTALANDRFGMSALYRTLPRDFHIPAVAAFRGWACERDFRGTRCY